MDFLANLSGYSIFLILVLVGLLALWKYYRSRGGAVSWGNTPILNGFSKDITEMARRGDLDPVIGREKEIRHLIMILSKRTKNNAVLIGEAGVGKTTIAEGLSQQIIDKTVPPDLYNKRVLALDLNSLLSGTKYRGEFEGRVKQITEEITRSKRSIILFIDEIHNLIESESSGESISVGDIFKPAMARGDLQIVGATTRSEYDQYFSKDQAFKRRLQPIFVSEPTPKETLNILRGIKKKYEDYHHVQIPDGTLVACIELSEKVLVDRSFPDKAIDLMDEASSKVRIECIKDGACPNDPVVETEDVAKIVAEYKKVRS